MTKRTLFSQAVLCVQALAAVAILLGSVNDARAERIRVGLQKFLSYANVFIALDKGYFRDAGLDIETTMVRGGGAATFTEVLAGQLDISSGAITASMLNAVIHGAKIKVIADKGQVREGHSTNELWVTKALYDSGVRDISGLRGKTIATSAPGGSDWIMIGLMAAKHGMSLINKDVLAANLSGPLRSGALENGTVAGALLVEPFISKVDITKAVLLTRMTDVMPVFQTAVFYTNESFLKDHAAAVEKFLAAIKKATAEYQKNPKADDIVAILSKYTGVSPEVIKKATPAYFSPDAKVNVSAIKLTEEFLLKNKLISREVSLDEFVVKSAM